MHRQHRRFRHSKTVTFVAEKDLITKVQEIASEEGVYASEIVRRAITLFVEDVKRDAPNQKPSEKA